YFTENPLKWVQFIGIEEFQRLDALAQRVAKFTADELEDIYRRLRRELAQLRGEPVPTFRDPKPRKKSKRASGKRARPLQSRPVRPERVDRTKYLDGSAA